MNDEFKKTPSDTSDLFELMVFLIRLYKIWKKRSIANHMRVSNMYIDIYVLVTPEKQMHKENS